MGKKKRQEFSAILDKSTDHEGVKTCVHIAKGINLNRLKPKRNSKVQQKRLGILDLAATEDKESLWICLKCAQLDCGRKQHTDNKPADLHTISFNISSKKAWCNVCNIYFGAKDNQKVNRAFQYLQQHLEDSSEEYESEKIEGKILYEPEEDYKKKKEFKGVVKSSVVAPRGMKNLGNTCYFNVVLQCLARTPDFISQMERMKEERIITLDSDMLQEDSENAAEVKVKMDKWMDFSDLLLKSLEELNMPEREPYVPIKLLNELHRVSNTITKDEQHDAHELLREVLQKIKEVDQQRLKSTILKNFKPANTMTKEQMDEAIQHMIKTYENRTVKKAFLEEIFGGSLVSILKCQECGNTSYTNEPFLDLSLPITDKTTTSFEMNVNKDIDTNPQKKQDFQQQKKNCKTAVNKDKSQKNKETEHNEADVEDSFEHETRNSWNEESGYDQENLEHPLKSPLSSRSPVCSIDNEKVLSLSPPCINNADGRPAAISESNMGSGKGAESKDGEHKDCIKNVNCNNVDATLGASGERIMSAVEGVESKISEHKEYMKDLALSSPCCNSTSCSKNLGFSPATPEDKSEGITITAEATKIKYVEHEDYTKYLAVSSPCSKTAGTVAATPLGNSNCIVNAAEGSESQDREHEDSEKNLAATTCLSSLCRESTGSPLSDRDSSSPVSSEINIDCSVSIRMHAGCSSPVSPDCNGYRPVSRFAFCDDVDSVARCSPVNEISSVSLKAAVNELNSKSSNHTVSPVKPSTCNETSCNDPEFLECSGENNSLSANGNEYSGVNLNQTEILESVKKLNLNDGDNLGICVPLNYTNAKGMMSPEVKQKGRKNQSNVRPAQEKSPELDLPKFTLTCCLDNFTAVELMTDCERVACSHCTARSGKGQVFTTNTKQIQIKSTPAVLILHLKRFEFKTDGGCLKTRKSTRPKKLNRHVHFPSMLDVSPYIYNENQEKINLRPRLNGSLYSLYAVIEHTGSINQGHYVVYIKSKPAKTEPFHSKDMNENECEKGGGMSLPAEWFSVSDESVNKMDENDVLKVQAYILFYEKC